MPTSVPTDKLSLLHHPHYWLCLLEYAPLMTPKTPTHMDLITSSMTGVRISERQYDEEKEEDLLELPDGFLTEDQEQDTNMSETLYVNETETDLM